MNFNEANAVNHPVQKEWHFKILTDLGFEPTTRFATGFVRCYEYMHPSGVTIHCHTGVAQDYWTANEKTGRWYELEPYIKSLGL